MCRDVLTNGVMMKLEISGKGAQLLILERHLAKLWIKLVESWCDDQRTMMSGCIER